MLRWQTKTVLVTPLLSINVTVTITPNGKNLFCSKPDTPWAQKSPLYRGLKNGRLNVQRDKCQSIFIFNNCAGLVAPRCNAVEFHEVETGTVDLN